MCGRIQLPKGASQELADFIDNVEWPDVDRYNVGPMQWVPIVRLDADGNPELASARWSLLPAWSKTSKTKYSTFNARSETAFTAPSFRAAMKRHRCLVPVAGWYEWQKLEKGKQAWSIAPAKASLLWLAGCWETWRDAESGEVIDSFAVLTTAAATALRFVHHRQPALIDQEVKLTWLDPETSSEHLAPMLRPQIPLELRATPVSNYVNNVRHEGPRCIEPVGEPVLIPTED